MAFNLVWDAVGARKFETGVDRGVLYPQEKGTYPAGYAWNGLSAVTEKPSGAESTAIYADNMKYLNLLSNEDFAASVEAYTYPEEFAPCNGESQPVPGLRITQQNRKAFGMSYRTLIGNDTEGTDFGYLIHLVYGANAAPSEKNNQTVNESPEATTMSWELSTTPVAITAVDPTTGKVYKPSAHLIVDSTTLDASKLAALENILYGSGETAARLPDPDEVIALLSGTTNTEQTEQTTQS